MQQVPGLHVLTDKERQQLRKLVDSQGLAAAARTLGLSRGVVASSAGGIGVRRGSLELIREALAAQHNGVSVK